jgi:MYXO-CTERM domain-containing protein
VVLYRTIKAAALLAVTLALASAPAQVTADVVMPPPTDCPDGQVGVTSHGGPTCLAVAPTDCPTGWRGQLGGNCALAPCAADANCSAGEACVEHAVCLQPFEDEYYDYGEDEREEHGLLEPHPSDLLRSPGLLAGPMMPKKKRQKPIVRYDAVNLCASGIACEAPGTCQPEKLCVPRGSRALAYRGKNIQPRRVARKTETPLTASGAEPNEVPAAILSTSRPGAKGCAGCATAPAPDQTAALGAAAAAIIALARRRRDARKAGRAAGIND